MKGIMRHGTQDDNEECNTLFCICEVLGGLGQLGLDVLLGLHLSLHLELQIQQVLLSLSL